VYPGPVPYTDSLIVLDASTGRLLWTDQVTPHDVRDYDFQATPVLVGRSVVGAGKAGLVISWNTRTHGRAWVTRVGLHRHDTGPLPRRPVTVCPGLLGGVETPMAAASGRIFVPVVDLCWRESAVSQARVDAVDPSRGRGRFVALDAADGRIIWQRRFASPDFGCAAVANGVVFTSTYDGTIYALSTLTGATLWHARLPAGINACPMLTGDMVVIGAGIPDERGRPQIVAFSVERAA
jgi:alcohol dehydrogenase (cytochrome c)